MLFVLGATAVYRVVSHVQERVTIWLHPWTTDPVPCAITGTDALRQDCGSFQLVRSLYSIANGGFGGTGLGRGTFTTTSGDPILPFLNTDFIYSAIAQELGLIGACGLILVYMLFITRGCGSRSSRRTALEAARRRAHVRLRAAGVHHRRRRAAGDPADRDHAPVRLLRRLERRRRLRPARAPPPRLQPRERGASVNKQITRLAVAGLVLMVALVVATTYWQTWAAAGLADRQDNAIERVAQFTIKRGEITDRGRVLARNRARKLGGRTLYFRRYPQGKLTAHIVGYSTPSRFRSGLERSLNDYLTASNANLSTVVRSTLDKLKGGTVTGNDVRLTMDLRGQQAAYDALAGRCGAVVAIDVATGKLLVSPRPRRTTRTSSRASST